MTARRRKRRTDPYQLQGGNGRYERKQRVWLHTHYGWKPGWIADLFSTSDKFYHVQERRGCVHVMHRRNLRPRDKARLGKDRPRIRRRRER